MSYFGKLVRHFSYIKLFSPYVWSSASYDLKFRVILSIFLLILSKLSAILIPVFFKQVVDSLSAQPLVLTLPFWFIVAYGTVRICSQIFNELKDVIFANVVQNTTRKLSTKVFRHLYDLGMEYHLEKQTGSLTNSLQRGIKSIEKLLTFMMFFALPTSFEIVFVCIILCIYYPIIYVIITITILLFYSIYTILVSSWRTQYIHQMNAAENEAMAKAVDGLTNYEIVRYFCNEDYESNQLDTLLKKYEKVSLVNKNGLMILNVGQNIIISLGLTALMMTAGYNIVSGTLTLGDFILLNSYLLQLYQPLGNLGFAYREIKAAVIDVSAIFDILDEPPHIEDKKNAIDLQISSPKIEFNNVIFGYKDREPIFKSLSFTIEPGHTLAIVGSSGAGKSTISKLIFRLYDVIGGNLTINDYNIKDLTQESFRKIIGIVPQDSVLFNDTILHNITYAKPDAAIDEVIAVAKMAEIHDFIMKMPKQYHSLVGERGLKLSGGEKQRISIARALLKKPSILIFDEATSALDTKTERAIQKTLSKISAGKTTLIIAHRLSTVIHADRIIVLNQGAIAEQGTHRELLSKKGIYYDMWSQQKKKKNKSEE